MTSVRKVCAPEQFQKAKMSEKFDRLASSHQLTQKGGQWGVLECLIALWEYQWITRLGGARRGSYAIFYVVIPEVGKVSIHQGSQIIKQRISRISGRKRMLELWKVKTKKILADALNQKSIKDEKVGKRLKNTCCNREKIPRFDHLVVLQRTSFPKFRYKILDSARMRPTEIFPVHTKECERRDRRQWRNQM